MLRCPWCGTTVREDNFCSECGRAMAAPEAHREPGEGAQCARPAPQHAKSRESGEGENAPAVGMWTYVGLMLLFGIPVIGLVFAVVWACGGSHNKNIVNFARAHLVVAAIATALFVLLAAAAAIFFAAFAPGFFEELFDVIERAFEGKTIIIK